MAYSQGRWNRQGEFAALYTAGTPEGARAELARLVRSAGSALGRRELVSLDVVVDPVCDLTDPAGYADLVLRAGLSPHPDFFADLSQVPHRHCQSLAARARAEGFTALLVPSAAKAGEKNLIIYVDVVAPKHLKLENGPDRIVL